MIGVIGGGPQQSASPFIRDLRRDLLAQVVPEMEFTLKVAVLAAAGRNRAEIASHLSVTDLEVRMAIERLKRIGEGWR